MATSRNPNPFPITRPARSSIHPSHLPPPPSLLWSTLSVASTLASIIFFCFINSFKSLSYFYTIPIIFLLYFTSRLYTLLFSNLHRLPQPHPLTLGLIDATAYGQRYLAWFYPQEDSFQVVLFFVAVTVNAMAITKLLKGWKEGKVFQHLMFAAFIRVSKMMFLHGWGFIGYLYGSLYLCLCALFYYFQISEGFIKRGN